MKNCTINYYCYCYYYYDYDYEYYFFLRKRGNWPRATKILIKEAH